MLTQTHTATEITYIVVHDTVIAELSEVPSYIMRTYSMRHYGETWKLVRGKDTRDALEKLPIPAAQAREELAIRYVGYGVR